MVSFINEWVCGTYSLLLPIEAIERIHDIFSLRLSTSKDLVIWIEDLDGSFSYKGSYYAIKDLSHKVMEDKFRWIWKWFRLERLRCFLWKVVCGCLFTRTQRVHRHMPSNNLCSICGNANESILHILCDCQFASKVRHYVFYVNLTNEFFTIDLNRWILNNLKSVYVENVKIVASFYCSVIQCVEGSKQVDFFSSILFPPQEASPHKSCTKRRQYQTLVYLALSRGWLGGS